MNFTVPASGSSPRMRGTLRPRNRVLIFAGIIPAYAGNTPPMLPLCRIGWDHPRVCGEHMLNIDMMVINSGSSPRMRGTHFEHFPSVPDVGIIPAYAGNTPYRNIRASADWDHPRVCGEHPKTGRGVWTGAGSSPRMRGTLERILFEDGEERIIPAYAGNTEFLGTFAKLPWDHPRVCGEHPMSNPLVHRFLGSSPRMRGTP